MLASKQVSARTTLHTCQLHCFCAFGRRKALCIQVFQVFHWIRMSSVPAPAELPPPPSQSSKPAAVPGNKANSSPDSSEFEFVEGKSSSQGAAESVSAPSAPAPTTAPRSDPAPSSSSSKSSKEQVTSPTKRDDDDDEPGLLDWVKGASGGLLSKVAQKTKSSVETMITTLDPQMKDYIYSGGDIDILVASDKPSKVQPIRDAFQSVFGLATVNGKASPASVSIAEQPVGYAAGRQGALERIQMMRSKKLAEPDALVVAVEGFLLEVSDDSWVEMSCLVLSDPSRKISLTTYSQPTPVDTRFVEMAKAKTPDNFPKRWSGLAATIGGVISETWEIPPSEWQEAVCGVSRSKMIHLAAEVLAGLYKRALAEQQMLPNQS